MLRRSFATLYALLFATAAMLSTAAFAAPSPAVTVASVRTKDITPVHQFIGRVSPIQSVQIHALVQGILQSVNFKEGSDVKAGQLLFVIDPAMYQAQVANAQALVAQAQATLENSQKTVERDQALIKTQATAQATLDQAIATEHANAAALQSVQAQLSIAEINLGYTKITAPISGRIGAATVTKGNLVSTSTGPLATIVQLDPIRVIFSAPDQDLVTAEQKDGSSVKNMTNAFVPRLLFENGTRYDAPGRLDFISNQVDQATGTIPVYAEFANPRSLLVPGQFVRVTVRPASSQDALVVPVAAVQQDNKGKYVLTVDSKNQVQQQRFAATKLSGSDWIVESGLEAGQRVIVDGLQKVKAGERVNPEPAPAAQQDASDQ